MPKIKQPSPIKITRKFPPANTIEERENQLISLAYDLVEERIRNNTATSQETTHFLKMGSPKERKDRAIQEEQIKLLKAKTAAYESAKNTEELYLKAIKAMAVYNGAEEDPEDD